MVWFCFDFDLDLLFLLFESYRNVIVKFLLGIIVIERFAWFFAVVVARICLKEAKFLRFRERAMCVE